MTARRCRLIGAPANAEMSALDHAESVPRRDRVVEQFTDGYRPECSHGQAVKQTETSGALKGI